MASCEGSCSKWTQHVVSTLPDVCKTPPHGDHVPYQISAECRKAIDDIVSVRFNGFSAHNSNTWIGPFEGNAAGSMGGVKSEVNKGYGYSVAEECERVRIFDKKATAHGTKYWANCRFKDRQGNTLARQISFEIPNPPKDREVVISAAKERKGPIWEDWTERPDWAEPAGQRFGQGCIEGATGIDAAAGSDDMSMMGMGNEAGAWGYAGCKMGSWISAGIGGPQTIKTVLSKAPSLAKAAKGLVPIVNELAEKQAVKTAATINKAKLGLVVLNKLGVFDSNEQSRETPHHPTPQAIPTRVPELQSTSRSPSLSPLASPTQTPSPVAHPSPSAQP